MDATGAYGVADEAEVGIFGFVSSDFEPLGGTLKQEPEDFVVWERRLDGALVRPPLVERRSRVRKTRPSVAADGEIDEHWPDVLLSRTKVQAVSSGSLVYDEGKSKPAADVDSAEFLVFSMWKRCADTLEVLGGLASALQVPIGKLGFAGIKDSRAVTCQEVTVPRRVRRGDDASPLSITPELLLEAVAMTGDHVRIGGFTASDSPLYPGRLIGNRFKIRIRAVKPLRIASHALQARTLSNAEQPRLPGSDIVTSTCEQRLDSSMKVSLESAIEAVRRRGFVNYIGMQRFGKAGVRSDLVGLAYLQQDYEQCVSLILLGPPEGNAVSSVGPLPANAAARQRIWRTRLPKWAECFQRTWSAHSALNAMPDHTRRKLWVEHRLLQLMRKLQQRPNDDEDAEQLTWPELCRHAFLRLPRNIRSLYVFAYCDRLWNLCASERIAMSPEAPVAGDLVWADRELRTVRHLKASEVSEHSVFDVVLPRAGTAVLSPANTIGTLMAQYLRYDGLDMQELAMEILPRDAARAVDTPAAAAEGEEDAAGDGEESAWWPLVGDYRELLCRPSRVRWSSEREEAPAAGGGPEDKLYSVLLRFDLPRGAYATMLFRELCRSRGSAPRRGSARRSHVVFDESGDEAGSPPTKMQRRCEAA